MGKSVFGERTAMPKVNFESKIITIKKVMSGVIDENQFLLLRKTKNTKSYTYRQLDWIRSANLLALLLNTLIEIQFNLARPTL